MLGAECACCELKVHCEKESTSCYGAGSFFFGSSSPDAVDFTIDTDAAALVYYQSSCKVVASSFAKELKRCA